MGGEPDYLHRKDAVTISPVHEASHPPSGVDYIGYGRTLQQIILGVCRIRTHEYVSGLYEP